MSTKGNRAGLVSLGLATLLISVQPGVFAQQGRTRGPGSANRSAFTLDPGKRSVVVPFTLIGSTILVQASVNNSQPLWMIFDTGTSTTAVDSRIASSMGLRSSADGTGSSTVSIPGLQATNQPVNALPMDTVSRNLAYNVQGILGSSFIQGWAVKIDYAAKTMTFYDARSFPAPTGQGSLPLVTVGGSAYVSADLSLTGNNTASGLFQVNTGSNQTLSVNKNFADAENVQSKIPQAQTVAADSGMPTDARISRLRLGAYTISQPVIHISADNAGVPVLPAAAAATGDTGAGTNGVAPAAPAPAAPGGRGNRRRRGFQGNPATPAAPPAATPVDRRAANEQRVANAVGGVIGGGLLDRFTVILDYPAHVMSLQSNAQYNTPFEADMSGLTLSAAANGIAIQAVRDSYPAATAGLRAGDLIVAVNGRAATGIGPNTLADMFKQAGATYALTVQRSGNTAQFSLTMQRMI